MSSPSTHLIVLGLNHNTAPVSEREKLYISEETRDKLFNRLVSEGKVESIIISTCNRTEFYLSGEDDGAISRQAVSILSTQFGIDEEWLERYTYRLQDTEAYKHLFRVASGLDSMVIGEPQILGQVKDAYSAAHAHNAAGPFLNKLFHRAFQVAKRVRTETKIGYNPVSISSMAVELARKIFGDFARKQTLVIGAGEMCEIALKHFKKEGLEEILVTNRTFTKAQQLAEEIIGSAHPFEEIPELLLRVDMVLSSTGAEQPIIDKTMIKTIMKKRKNRPLFFIDIAVPRDIDPGVNDLENIYLYDIDDLKELSQAHMSNRIQESEKAQAIIEDEVAKFNGWLKQLELNPLIAQIQEYLEAMRNSELHRTCQKLKNADPETLRQIDLLTKSIINKIIHPHMMMLKKNDSTAVLDIIKDLLLPREENENKMDRGDTGEQAGPQADRDCNQSPPDTLP